MQMNLCLSGLAGCYDKAAYPAVVHEAVARIRKARPDAVTFNEACRRDVARIARRTGYHLRFSKVIYNGEPLRCTHPGGRGLPGCWVIPRFFERNPDVPEARRWRAHWHLLAAEHGDGRGNLLKAAAIHPPSIRPGWLRVAVKGHAAWT